MACDWNNDLTVCGSDQKMRTLCLSACLLYAFSVEVCRILRTTFVTIFFCGFVKLGTTIVPQTWKGGANWLAVSRKTVWSAFKRCVSRSCFACLSSCRTCRIVLVMYAHFEFDVSFSEMPGGMSFTA